MRKGWGPRSQRGRVRRGVALVAALAVGSSVLGINSGAAAQGSPSPISVPSGALPVPTPGDSSGSGVVVRFKDAPDPADGFVAMSADDAVDALGDAVDESNDVEMLPSGSVRVEVDSEDVDDVVADLSARSDVEFAEPEVFFQATAVPNDPEYGAQWHLPLVRAPQAWDHTQGSATVKVAVIDTAIDAGHPDLAGKIVANETVYSRWCYPDWPANNHGTAVAGLVGAATSNATNVAGTGWNTSIIGIETLCGGLASSPAVAAAIIRAVQLGADVINLSLGNTFSSSELQTAIDYAHATGVIVVASAGNDSTTTMHYPAAYEGVIAVAATNSSNNLAGFSTRGSWVEIAAPGEGVLSLCNRGSGCNTANFNGTSFSAPIVSGAIALLVGCERDIGVNGIRSRLQHTSTPTAGTGTDFAWGLLNVEALITAPSPGYATVTSNGALDAFGGACNPGDLRSIPLNLPIVGAAATPSRFGYWMVASDGGVFSFGNAAFYGSTGNIALNQPIVGMASTPSGSGYRMVARDGGIFAFGDAGFYGSTGNIRLNQPIVGMASTPSGNGYWLVASDGGIFAFGDAAFYGSTGAIKLNQPIVGMASTPSGNGYWLVASDGGIFAFGDAGFYGSTGAIRLNQPITAMAATPTGAGYWMVARDGGMFNFGDAAFYGSASGRHFTNTVSLLVA